MYYPYLRGKQFEMILLRDNAEFLAGNSIHPIIEPVKKNFKALVRAIKALNEKDVNFTFIVNPGAGQDPVRTSDILEQLIDNTFAGFKKLSIGYILHAESKITDFVALLNKYNDLSFSVLHYGYTNGKELAKAIKDHDNVERHLFIDGYAGKLYQRHLRANGVKRVLIRDGFKSQKKNSLYPQSEHFSDLHITYPDERMDGFGDYLIVGDDYSETGGPAYAVAIHLTYFDGDDDMFIYHFLSDQTDSPIDPGGKFLEALEKLVEAINKPKSLIFRSRACNEFLDLYSKKHYPGLGYVKKLSMQHHIELTADFMNREN